jgi:hypothetical protein
MVPRIGIDFSLTTFFVLEMKCVFCEEKTEILLLLTAVYRLQRFLSFAYKLRMGGELIGIEMKL